LLRPAFELLVEEPPTVVMVRLRQRLAARSAGAAGVSAGDHAELFMPASQRRIWSPWLSVTIQPSASGALVRGRFSPHPSVWTLLMFVVFLSVFAGFVGLVWGIVQWSLDLEPWALIASAATLPPLLGVRAAGRVGQRRAAGQMRELEAVLLRLIAPEDRELDPGHPRIS